MMRSESRPVHLVGGGWDADAAETLYGVLVGGRLTPRYHHALVAGGADWPAPEIPYLGFSAGAAIAPSTALLGGWLTEAGGPPCVIGPEDNGEELDPVTVDENTSLVVEGEHWTVRGTGFV